MVGPIVLLKLPPTLLNIDDRRANVTTTMLEESISVYCGVMPVGFRSIKALHMGFQENVMYCIHTLKSCGSYGNSALFLQRSQYIGLHFYVLKKTQNCMCSS